MLLVEGWLIDANFDANPILEQSDSWWARFLVHAGVIRLATASATAIVLLAGRRLWDDLKTSLETSQRRFAWPFLVAHLLVFATFFHLSGFLFAAAAVAPPPLTSVAAWSAAGFATIATWGAFLLPLPVLLAFAARAILIVLGCATLGAVALYVGLVSGALWRPLGQSTLRVVSWILGAFTDDLVIAPERFIVGTREFRIEITPECSGYQGIGLICVFLAVYLWVFRGALRFPRAFLLVPIGVAVMWFANTIRIAALIGIGALVSPEVALGGFHSNSGFLFLCVVALAIGWGAQQSPFFTVADARRTETVPWRSTAAYVAPLVIGVTTAMVTGALAADGFDGYYGLRVATVAAALWAFRDQYAGLRYEWSWFAAGVGVVVFLLWLPLQPTATNGASSAFAGHLASMSRLGALTWLVVRTLGAVVTVPIVEELAFRGYLTRRIIARDFERVPPGRFSWVSFLGSSLLFGAVHDPFLAGTVAGMFYAVAFYRRGFLCDAVIAHGMTNALLAVHVLATGSWMLW